MAAILETIVTEKYSGKTVENVLRKEFGVSSTLMKKLKNNKKLFLNGNACKTVDICSCGDRICADVSENEKGFGEILPWEVNLDILFEDDYFLIVNKPGNMASHPCLGNRDSTLANAVMYYWSRFGEYHTYHIVNRLDKDTSGICVIAKNSYAHGTLSEQIKNRVFERKYTAVVHGKLFPEDGVIEFPIRREEESVIKRIVADDGKYAKTVYKTIRSCEKFSLVDICLETGRTHQIRVHFSHIGNPLVGDWLYGFGDDEKTLIDRQALHAGFIKFSHPVTKKTIEIYTDLPEDMQNLLNHL